MGACSPPFCGPLHSATSEALLPPMHPFCMNTFKKW